MDINASSTCRYLKHKRREDVDLAKTCLSLKLVAMCSEDVKVLTALYRLYTDGGTIHIESPKTGLTLDGTLDGIELERSAPSDHT